MIIDLPIVLGTLLLIGVAVFAAALVGNGDRI